MHEESEERDIVLLLPVVCTERRPYRWGPLALKS
jgi:hypothetical protein